MPNTEIFEPDCASLTETVGMEAMLNRIKHPDSPVHRVTLKGRIIVRESAQGPVRK